MFGGARQLMVGIWTGVATVQRWILLGITVVSVLTTLAPAWGTGLLAPANTAPDAWQEAFQAGEDASRRGDSVNAVHGFEQALAFANGFATNDPRRFKLLRRLSGELRNLARYWAQQPGEHRKVEPTLERAIATMELAVGQDGPELAPLLEELASYYLVFDPHINPERHLSIEAALTSHRKVALLYQRAQQLLEKSFGPASPEVAANLSKQADFHFRIRHRPDIAEPLAIRSHAISQQVSGPFQWEVLSLLAEIAVSLNKRQDIDAYLSKLVIAIQSHPEGFAVSTGMLIPNGAQERFIAATFALGTPAEVEKFLRAATVGEQSFDGDYFLRQLAQLKEQQGNYREAAHLYEKRLQHKERLAKSGSRPQPDPYFLLQAVADAAWARHASGQRRAAEKLYKRAIALSASMRSLEFDLDEHERALADAIMFYEDLGAHDKAMPYRSKLLDLRRERPREAERIMGMGEDVYLASFLVRAGEGYGRSPARVDRHHRVAMDMGSRAAQRLLAQASTGASAGDMTRVWGVASWFVEQDALEQAEPLYLRVVEMLEHTKTDDPLYARALIELASIYSKLGRQREAEPLFRRALDLATLWHFPKAVNGLADTLYRLGLTDEALPLYQRIVGTLEKQAISTSAFDSELIRGLRGLGTVQKDKQQFAEAEKTYCRALEHCAKGLCQYQVTNLAPLLDGLASVYLSQGKYAEAEYAYGRALELKRGAAGTWHSGLADSQMGLARTYRASGDIDRALAYSRAATAIHQKGLHQASQSRPGSEWHARKRQRDAYLNHIGILAEKAEHAADASILESEAFEGGQFANLASSAGAVARLSARFAAGSGKLARTIREQQDTTAALERIEARLLSQIGQAPSTRDRLLEGGLRLASRQLEARLNELDDRIRQDFPGYAELLKPRAVTLAEIQPRLSQDQALLVYVTAENGTFLWVVRKHAFKMYKLDASSKQISQIVRTLRNAVDLSTGRGMPPFPLAEAYRLYSLILAPAHDLLAGAQHLLVVTDGPLLGMPLHWLVTEPTTNLRPTYTEYRHAPWLIRQYAVTVLPSVGSLDALRRLEKRPRALKPFVGFGDPLLGDGEATTSNSRGTDFRSLYGAAGLAIPDEIRRFARLPESAEELNEMADYFHADRREDLYLDAKATERELRKVNLEKYRVVVFATHGLMAGELTGLDEPALVLTPPKLASTADDGLATASEIATLKLNADWVLLSACNTAAADGTPEAEGFSGLTRAFLYAGSRALLVSHWYVGSDATARLTTRTIGEMVRTPSLRKAEALRRAMVELLDDPDRAVFSHPAMWAPFVVVGGI